MSILLFIENVKCGGCAASIQRSLKADPAVSEVAVDVATGEVKIETSTPENAPIYAEKLAQLGYPQSGHNSAMLRARSYVSCAIGKMKT